VNTKIDRENDRFADHVRIHRVYIISDFDKRHYNISIAYAHTIIFIISDRFNVRTHKHINVSIACRYLSRYYY